MICEPQTLNFKVESQSVHNEIKLIVPIVFFKFQVSGALFGGSQNRDKTQYKTIGNRPVASTVSLSCCGMARAWFLSSLM